MASVTISGGYFPARSFHPIHFISLFLLPTLLTTISFTNIFKFFSLGQINFKMPKRGHEKYYEMIKDIEKVNCLIQKINWWPERCKKSGKLCFVGLHHINMIKGGEAWGPVHCLLEQRRAIIWGGIRPFYSWSASQSAAAQSQNLQHYFELHSAPF